MFATHQPIIGHFAKKSPENTWKLLAMVQASIRMKFYRLPELLKNPEHLTARQREYIAEYWTRRNEIYAALHSNESTREKMRYLVELPGLGIPKAGFVMQLAHGTVGCLDTHNLERYGLSKGVQVQWMHYATVDGEAGHLFAHMPEYRLCDALGHLV